MLATLLSDHQTTVAAALFLQLIQLAISFYTNRKVKAVRSEQKVIKASLISSENSPLEGGEK